MARLVTVTNLPKLCFFAFQLVLTNSKPFPLIIRPKNISKHTRKPKMQLEIEITHTKNIKTQNHNQNKQYTTKILLNKYAYLHCIVSSDAPVQQLEHRSYLK